MVWKSVMAYAQGQAKIFSSLSETLRIVILIAVIIVS